MAIDIKLPELGEGIESADVLEVLVKEGQQVEKDQGLIEIETDKATVQVPSSQAGQVKKVHVRPGDTIQIGAPLISLEPSGAAAAGAETAAKPEKKPVAQKTAPEKQQKPAAEKQSAEKKPENDEPTDEGDTEAKVSAQTPPREDATQTDSPRPRATSATSAPAAESRGSEDDPAQKTPTGDDGTGQAPVAAGPAVRRFAREVGVDLRRVRGTGPGGRVTRDDVLEVVRQANQAANDGARPPGMTMDAWGSVRMEKLSKIRRTIAQRMHESWTNVPRVTNFDDADVTELERMREASKADYAGKGIKLTALPFLIKAVSMALQSHPQINAALDLENEQVIYKQYLNIGVAVDNERGLVVPVLRNVEDKSIPEIVRGLATLAEKVRNNNYTLEDLRGGTFTVSNLGAIGGTYSTPIVNIPEVAILLAGRSRQMPVVVEDKIAIRLMMPLSLSYDHRLVDGAAAARFLNDVIGYLEAPGRLLLAP